jgi:hypothetical protein
MCRDAECVDKALRAGQLAHAFKRPSEAPKDHEALNHKVRR